ncbi:DUF4133 domain-containing protein [Ornithobacterium rhinotracheale]|uniref:DUF4133 domain-containing protein n=1 Tax=Ornithobacterium rhinotracheale TaxID=28251 RepID=UPI0040370A0E
MAYYLYKGLKKPLVFFGLKGKYVYRALLSGIVGIVTLAILSKIIGIMGVLIGLGIGGGGIWFCFHSQDKKGLFNKTKNNEELHIFPKKLKIKKQDTNSVKNEN